MQSDVKEKLRRLDAMRQAVQNLPAEIRRCQAAGEDTSRLRGALYQAQLWVETTERALQTLLPQERLVAELLFICPEKGNVQRLCAILGVEQSSVYRRRARVLSKLAAALYGQTDP